jgi:anti-anti-sigma factor
MSDTSSRPNPLVWPLSIQVEQARGVTIVLPRGRLGTLTSGELIQALVDVIRGGSRRLILDLEGVDYISSAGLLALDAVLGRAHVSQAQLVLCGITEPVRVAFDLAGLLDHFLVVNTRAEAVLLVEGHGPSEPDGLSSCE